jgi:hypothetical protein
MSSGGVGLDVRGDVDEPSGSEHRQQRRREQPFGVLARVGHVRRDVHQHRTSSDRGLRRDGLQALTLRPRRVSFQTGDRHRSTVRRSISTAQRAAAARLCIVKDG